ncbi:MAG: hypothetical protein IPG95_05500 [Saprospiraceae bacterium]|nr:hypothetical protein [Saprospiraceae bacterium]
MATFAQAGTGIIVLSTVLSNRVDAGGAVGFQPSGTCVCANGNLVNNINTTEHSARFNKPLMMQIHKMAIRFLLGQELC